MSLEIRAKLGQVDTKCPTFSRKKLYTEWKNSNTTKKSWPEPTKGGAHPNTGSVAKELELPQHSHTLGLYIQIDFGPSFLVVDEKKKSSSIPSFILKLPANRTGAYLLPPNIMLL